MEYEGRIRTSAIDWASLVLVIVGALVWGLVGIGMFLDANWNVVTMLFGSFPTVEALIYLLVGLGGVYELYFAYQLYDARSPEESVRERTT